MPRQPKNRVGEIYGNLTVVKISNKKSKAGNTYWWCICSCGNKREVASYSLSNQIRKKNNITSCKECSKQIALEWIYSQKIKEEESRRKEAIRIRKELIGQVPTEWLTLPLTDAEARELGKTQFFRGKRCLNNHLSPYRINGGCLECAKKPK